jgi:hypothetical protein
MAKKKVQEPSKQNHTVKTRVKHQNYSKGEDKMELEKVITEWMNKTGRYFESNKERCPMDQSCGYVGISYNTMMTYVGGNNETRRTLGCGVSAQCLIESKKQKSLSNVMARKDRANEGLAVSEGIDSMQEVLPNLSQTQAQRSFVSTVQGKHNDVLKNKLVFTQGTTMKRTGITIPQQFRWMSTKDKLVVFLREKNSGTCNLTDKSFGEVIHNFIYGGNLTCIQACDNGACRVLNSTGRKKHKNKNQYSRVSITMWHTGSIAGVTGPCILLYEGKTHNKNYTDKFLQDNIAAPGSCIIMTSAAFMTEDYWIEASPNIIYSIQNTDPIGKAAIC